MARKSNPEATVMSVRVNVRDLAKAGRYLVEYCGQVPTGRGSILAAMLRMGAILWENEKRKEGRLADIEVEQANRWLDERWPRVIGGQKMRMGLVRAGEESARGMESFYKDREEAANKIGREEEPMSEAELREFHEMMRKEAERQGEVWKYGDRNEELVEVIEDDGGSFLYDKKTLDVYTAGGKRVYGMKYDVENRKRTIDPEYVKLMQEKGLLKE